MRETTAPLIALLDADDQYLPHALEAMSSYLAAYPEVGVVAADTQALDATGTIRQPWVAGSEALTLADLAMGNPLNASAVMLRRDWLERAGIFDESLRACEDWDLWLRMAAVGCPFGRLRQVVSAWRLHAGQITREAVRMRTAMLVVLDKFFARPDLPPEIYALRDRARTAALLRSAGRAYHAEDYTVAQADLAEAVRLDPALAADGCRLLIDHLAGWANHPHPQSPPPDVYLRRVYDYPPAGVPGLRPALRRAIAASLLGPLFAAAPELRREKRARLLRALRCDPTWLRNRGVWRLLADAWSPFPRRRSV